MPPFLKSLGTSITAFLTRNETMVAVWAFCRPFVLHNKTHILAAVAGSVVGALITDLLK